MRQSSSVLSQNRLIYDQLELVLWADRTQPTMRIMPDVGLKQEFKQENHQTTTSAQSAQIIKNNLSVDNKTRKEQASARPNAVSYTEVSSYLDKLAKKISTNQDIIQNTAQDTSNSKSTNTTQPSDAADLFIDTIKFHLQAFSYCDWMVLIDHTDLDSAELTTWQSLTAALNKSQQGVFAMREMHYPSFDDDPFANQLSAVNSGFKGFIFGLRLKSPQVDKLAVLTALPSCLNLDELSMFKQINHQYSLHAMQNDPQLKKQFWQLLHT